jgi:hypothetical protein
MRLFGWLGLYDCYWPHKSFIYYNYYLTSSIYRDFEVLKLKIDYMKQQYYYIRSILYGKLYYYIIKSDQQNGIDRIIKKGLAIDQIG